MADPGGGGPNRPRPPFFGRFLFFFGRFLLFSGAASRNLDSRPPPPPFHRSWIRLCRGVTSNEAVGPIPHPRVKKRGKGYVFRGGRGTRVTRKKRVSNSRKFREKRYLNRYDQSSNVCVIIRGKGIYSKSL